MKKVLILSVLSIIFAITGNSQPFSYMMDLPVGVQPMGVVCDEVNKVNHIFCAGYDANFNGIKDSGDVNPSWWSMPALGYLSFYGENDKTPKKLRDFEFGSWDFFAPFNPGIYKNEDEKTAKIYISQFGRIRAYDMATGDLLDDTVAKYSPTAIYSSKDSLIFSVRSYGTSDIVYIFDLKTKQVIDSIHSGINVQKVQPIENGIVILNEGVYGVGDSKLIIAGHNANQWDTTGILLGNGANDFDIFNGRIVVAMNGSHEIKVISIAEKKIIKTINVGTTGYDGPRTIRFYHEYQGNQSSDVVGVTTYSGDIRFFNISTGNLIVKLDTYGKAEGFDIQGYTYLIVANQFGKGLYTPDSSISIFSTPQSVDDYQKTSAIRLYPNPSSDIINIDLTENIGSIERASIFSTNGILVAEVNLKNIDSDNITISLKDYNLPSGKYFVKLQGMLKSVNTEVNYIK